MCGLAGSARKDQRGVWERVSVGTTTRSQGNGLGLGRKELDSTGRLRISCPSTPVTTAGDREMG